MNNHSDFDTSAFHKAFDEAADNLTDRVRDVLIESSETTEINEEAIIGQLMMNELFPHACDPGLEDYNDIFKGKLTTEQKARLVKIADHMGPDWAQALYHVAVFLTKVA